MPRADSKLTWQRRVAKEHLQLLAVTLTCRLSLMTEDPGVNRPADTVRSTRRNLAARWKTRWL